MVRPLRSIRPRANAIALGKDRTHLAVNHSAGEYVRLGGFVHTNTIESVWALLKRQIIGIHYWVSSDVGVIAFVGVQDVAIRKAFEQRCARRAIGDLSAGGHEGERTALSVGQRVDIRFAALRVVVRPPRERPMA
jgi:hypothetical protein